MNAKPNNQPLVPINTINFPRCEARSKRHGGPCQQPAMKNGRCRFHGGKSTGARTPEGMERSRRGNWKHGEYSRESKFLRMMSAKTIQEARDTIKQMIEVLKRAENINPQTIRKAGVVS